VPRIGPALVAHDPIGTLGQYVDELPFPFIAPLRSDDDDRAIAVAEHEAVGGWENRESGLFDGQKNTPRGGTRGVV
jgi:hypothetical protein